MRLALIFMDCHPFGHSRRLIEESLRVCDSNRFCFYIKPEGLGIIPRKLLEGREVIEFKNHLEAIDKANRRGDIDAIVIFDLYDSLIQSLLEIDFCKRIIFYNASTNLLISSEKLKALAHKGYTFLWEHEVACYIFQKYVYSEGLCGILPYPVPFNLEIEVKEKPYDVSFPGSFEERKGASVFLLVLPDLLNARMRLNASILGHERLVGELAKYRGRMNLKEEPDNSQEEFLRDLVSSKVVFFAYDPYEHSFGGSGILRECMFYGVPVVATEGSLLSYYLSKVYGAWVPLSSRIDKGIVFEAINRALQGHEELKEKALKARLKVRAECSSLAFIEKLFRFIEGELENLSFDIPEVILRKAEAFFFFSKANLAWRKHMIEEAELEIDRALSIDSGYWRALFLKSDILSSKAGYKEALECLEIAETNPFISPLNKTYALLKKASVFEKMGKRSYCLDTINRIKGLRSYLSFRGLEELVELASVMDREFLSEIVLESENYLEALRSSCYRIRFILEIIYICLSLGMPIDSYVHKLLKEIDMISPHEEVMFKTDPMRIRNLFDKIFILLAKYNEKGLTKQLLSVFVRLFGKFAMEDPLYIYNLASLYEKIDDLDKAENLFKESLSRNFYNKSGIYFHLGEIALKRGNREEAICYYLLCLKYESNHSLAAKRLNELGVGKYGV